VRGQDEKRDAEFSEYVANRRQRLHRTAWLLCGDRDQAEDIVQTALSRVYASWSRISRVDSLDAYVRRVVVTTHLNERRRPWRRERAGLDGLDAAAPVGDDPVESDVLWSALRGLAPGQRTVVVLRHYWGLSVEETAADLGISPGTVKSQTSAALAHLRASLAVVPERGEHP
jgi:RNA polymerase sigma-70 factor (sigma-E family)